MSFPIVIGPNGDVESFVSVTLPPGTPEGDVAISDGSGGYEWAPGGGGGSPAWVDAGAGAPNLGDQTTQGAQGAGGVVYHMDGAGHFVAITGVVDALPPWLNDTGHIILPGVYLFALAILAGTAPTGANPEMFVSGVGQGTSQGSPTLNLPVTWQQVEDADLGGGEYVLTEPQSISEADLPYLARWFVAMPTDATGTVQIQAQASPLVYFA